MVAFLIRRFFGLIFVMFAVTFLTFMIGHAAPGDPIRTILGFRYDPATYRRLVHFYGLDRPLLVDRKSTRLNSSHSQISYAVFCLKKKRGWPRCSRTAIPSRTHERGALGSTPTSKNR